MTPEQRAAEVGISYDGRDDEENTANIAEAIRAAILEEREACALLCERWFEDDGVGSPDPARLAKAIRARS